MSEVWLAEDQRLGRWVAVKLFAGLGDDARIVTMREARVVARLQHPNIVTVFDVGSHNGQPFLVMEYVHGYSIRQLLDTQGRFTEAEAIRYGAPIANALDHAHHQSVIHRDVKPENILINENGVAKLTDFGIASGTTQTLAPGQADEILGTIAYLPPEVIQGAEPDARGDVYSLGLTIYEMVAGRLPFAGGTMAATAGQRLGAPAPPLRSFARSASLEIEAAVARALSLSPDDRFQTAADFGVALRAVPAAPSGSAPPIIAPPGRAPRPLTPQNPRSPRNPTTRVLRPTVGAGSTSPTTGGIRGTTLALVIGVVFLALGAGVAAALVLANNQGGGEVVVPTATVTRRASPQPTPQPTARPTNEPTLTPTPTGSPSPSPAPSPSPSATQTAPRPTGTTPQWTPTAAATSTMTPPKPSPSPAPTLPPTLTPVTPAPRP